MLRERGDPLFADSGRASSDILELLQEFRENLVDDEIPVQSLRMREVQIWVSTVFTLISLKIEIARSVKRTKITRAPCRRRNSGAVPRAANFGGLITADHKVLSDNCESRNNRRYAVVVQDLATRWIQAYPCRNKNFSGKTKELLNLAKVVKIFLGINVRLHHTDRKQMGLLKEQCAE